jgi:NAD+ synthase (glutamine-hydrolysing)
MEFERSKKFKYRRGNDGYTFVDFQLETGDFTLERKFAKTPFVPEDLQVRKERCEMVLNIQAHALCKRIEHTNTKKLVLGVSGGLDSTLAMLVCERALKLAGKKPEDLIAITMPCFGTSNRTYNNAIVLSKELKSTFVEIDIKESVLKHFEALGHDPLVTDVVYENSQARERTQVLMDYANKVGGLVVGTGDMSELALGWATYNGDHMSMYSVNSSVPKTMVKAIVIHEGEKRGGVLGKTLLDIADTPISPELMPSNKGEQTQPTEDFVGPYELNDFFLFTHIGLGYTPKKILRVSKTVFEGVYSDEVIERYLKLFMKRFFAQQFKRSAAPEGVNIGTLSLSTAVGFKIPSDMSAALWQDLED